MAPQRKNGNGGNNGKGGGAPAGGNGGSNDGGDDGDDDDEEQPLTRTEVMKLINGAVSGQLSRKLGPAIEAGMGPVLKKLDELKAKPADDDDDDEPEGDEGAGDEPPVVKKVKGGKPDPVVAKLQREQQALRRQLDEEKAQRAKEAEARKNSAIETSLTSALTELGVDKHRLRGALAVHKSSAFVDDAGSVLVKIKRDGYDEDLDPATYLKEWGATDEGKSYLAPTGSTGGSGARPPKTPGASRKPAASSPEAKAQKIQEAKTSLLTAVAGELAGGVVSVE